MFAAGDGEWEWTRTRVIGLRWFAYAPLWAKFTVTPNNGEENLELYDVLYVV